MWVASKSKSVNVCANYDAKGKVTVSNDEFNTNNDSIIVGKSNGAGVVCHDDRR
jgi:hypothetical protein